MPGVLINGGKAHHVRPYLRGVLLTVGGVQDESLKNLMMAWYYAGYYTGLHEGQKQSSVGSTTADKNEKRNP